MRHARDNRYAMPLTEREKRILQEIERNLHAEDPGLAQRSRSPRATYVRNLKLGVASFVMGLVILVLFFITTNPLVGLGAFAAMVTGVVLMAGATTRIASDEMERLQPRERALGAFRRWETMLRDRYRRR